MKPSAFLVATALAGAFVLPTVQASAQGPVPAEKPDYKFEKCYGIVKAGSNDCQTATTSCAGTARRSAQPDAWIYLPAGSCSKIVGASTSGK